MTNAPTSTTATLATIDTPVGPLTLITNDDVVLASGFTIDTDRLMNLVDVSLRPIDFERSACHQTIADAVAHYFAGSLDAINDVKVRQISTPLRERGWRELCGIRSGEPISYGELAKRMDIPLGARAAGQVCARNAVSLFVPCHRVIAANGSLNHYAWGLPVKLWLLDFEASRAT